MAIRKTAGARKGAKKAPSGHGAHRSTTKGAATKGTAKTSVKGVTKRVGNPHVRRVDPQAATVVSDSPVIGFVKLTKPRLAETAREGRKPRKNMYLSQSLIDKAKAVLGVKTESEAVEIGLGAVIEIGEFHRAMLTGFDRLMEVGGLAHDEDEERDFSGFLPPAKAR